MALTLVEASKLSNDMLLQGVVETIIKESSVLRQMPFIEIVGNGADLQPGEDPAQRGFL